MKWIQYLILVWPLTSQTTLVHPNCDCIALTGTLSSDNDRKPAPKVRIEVFQDAKQLAVTTSDQSGQYEVVLPNPNGKTLWLRVPGGQGYLPASEYITASATGTSVRRDIELRRGAVVHGRVVDPEGLPIENVTIRLINFVRRGQRPSINASYTLKTKADGSFQAGTIRPGKYFVSVSPPTLRFRTAMDPEVDHAEPAVAADQQRLVHFYLPDAESLELAIPIDLSKLSAPYALDITAKRRPTTCLQATLTFEGKVDKPVMLLLSEAYAGSGSILAAGRMNAPGPLTLCGLGQGSYVLKAEGNVDGQLVHGFYDLHITSSKPVQLGELKLTQGHSIPVTVSVRNSLGERKQLPANAAIGITLTPTNRRAGTAGGIRSIIDNDQGTILNGVPTGSYWIDVNNLPAGYFVNQVRSQGRDVYASKYEAPSSIDLELGNDAGSVLGLLVNDGFDSQSPQKVVLVLDSPGTELAPNAVAVTVSREDGTFSLRDIKPGKYRIMRIRDDGIPEASAEEIAAALRSGELIKVAASMATPVRIQIR